MLGAGGRLGGDVDETPVPAAARDRAAAPASVALRGTGPIQPAAVLHMQRLAGNRATSRLVRGVALRPTLARDIRDGYSAEALDADLRSETYLAAHPPTTAAALERWVGIAEREATRARNPRPILAAALMQAVAVRLRALIDAEALARIRPGSRGVAEMMLRNAIASAEEAAAGIRRECRRPSQPIALRRFRHWTDWLRSSMNFVRLAGGEANAADRGVDEGIARAYASAPIVIPALIVGTVAVAALATVAAPALVEEGAILAFTARGAWVLALQNPGGALAIGELALGATFSMIEAGGPLPFVRQRLTTPEGVAQTAVDIVTLRAATSGGGGGATSGTDEVVEVDAVPVARAGSTVQMRVVAVRRTPATGTQATDAASVPGVGTSATQAVPPPTAGEEWEQSNPSRPSRSVDSSPLEEVTASLGGGVGSPRARRPVPPVAGQFAAGRAGGGAANPEDDWQLPRYATIFRGSAERAGIGGRTEYETRGGGGTARAVALGQIGPDVDRQGPVVIRNRRGGEPARERQGVVENFVLRSPRTIGTTSLPAGTRVVLVRHTADPTQPPHFHVGYLPAGEVPVERGGEYVNLFDRTPYEHFVYDVPYRLEAGAAVPGQREFFTQSTLYGTPAPAGRANGRRTSN